MIAGKPRDESAARNYSSMEQALDEQEASAYYRAPDVSELRNAGLPTNEAVAIASCELLQEVSERLNALIKLGAPDAATAPAIGLLVSLLRAGRGSPATDEAASAIYALASRGSHGDTIRKAGGIPLLLDVLRDGEVDGGERAERASGALAHLVMQCAANRRVVLESDGVPVLAGLLTTEGSQAAEYAASTLAVLALCGTPTARDSVRDAISPLPPEVLERFPSLRAHLSAAAAGTEQTPTAHTCVGGAFAALAAPLACLGEWRRRVLAPSFGADGGGAPEEFLCPITHEVMADPVIASDGMGYDRHAIRQVLDRGSGVSPLTREALAHDVYANFELKRRIATWQRDGAPLLASRGPGSAHVRDAACVALGAVVVCAVMGWNVWMGRSACGFV